MHAWPSHATNCSARMMGRGHLRLAGAVQAGHLQLRVGARLVPHQQKDVAVAVPRIILCVVLPWQDLLKAALRLAGVQVLDVRRDG